MGIAAGLGLGAVASVGGALIGADAAGDAADTQSDAAKYAADLSQAQYEQTREDQMRWLDAGESALGTLEEMMANKPTMEDFEMSDYSKYMQGEGLAAIEAKSKAGGYYNTGATSREMLDYAQNTAGADYDNYLNQYYQSLNPYMSMAGMGQTQSNTMAQSSAQNAATQGSYITQAANAEAQGIIGTANAYTSSLSNLTGLGMAGLSSMGGSSSFQTPQGWGSQSTGSGFTSAWEN